jgi:glutamate-ammonia-ligase adenylyltransferase
MSENNVQSQLITEEWRRKLDTFTSRAADHSAWLSELCQADKAFESQLQKAWSCSEFIANYAVTQPHNFSELVESGDLTRCYSDSHYADTLQAATDKLTDDNQWSIALRRYRNREMARVIWRDFNGLAELEETTANMSALASACLDIPLRYLHKQTAEVWGRPIGKHSDTEQYLIVLGMGKLGANELNVSSDIDLIFVYPEGGETQGGSRQRNVSNQEFFERVGRGLIQLLDNRTVEGFVFRVDMRLRPYGKSGPLVGSFDALESYYQNQGRDWERFAMIKATPIAGDVEAGKALLKILRPFTYRKYIDFTAIQALRDIKGMIEQEVIRTNANDDVKRGRGGIREVEFIAQAFQLIRGGRDLRLRNPVLKDILPLLEQEGALSEGSAKRLYTAYVFLRHVEHAVQGMRDQQTQKLPQTALDKARLISVLGFEQWDDFCEQLDKHRSIVRQEFAEVVSESQDSRDDQQTDEHKTACSIWQLLVQPGEDINEQLITLIGQLKLENPKEIAALLTGFLTCKPIQLMQASARERLDTLMPSLLTGCVKAKNQLSLLQRVLSLIEAVARRSAYLLLLAENPLALQQLLILCGASPWIAEQITRYPALLDELLDPRSLYAPRNKQELADELRQQILRIPEEDLESQLEALRYFKRSNSLRVAACEVTDALPLMKVSDNLTWIAEVILDQVLELAWLQMKTRHGDPGCKEGDEPPSLLIVGYGKMGGIELGHNSDLDLVFIHNANINAFSNGDKSIDNGTYFARLGQKIIHMLGAQTASGMLYEVDMRLRPSGHSGMLVTSLKAFSKYQLDEAWTWEHQALVRARPVAGNELLAKAFNSARQQILCGKRDRQQLAMKVQEMRVKMANHLLKQTEKPGGALFNLKQGRGGIVDIEFMVQFLVLAEAATFPTLVHWSDNIRILDGVKAQQLLPPDQVGELIEAYQHYRSAGHRAQLQNEPVSVPVDQLMAERESVISIWDKILPSY